MFTVSLSMEAIAQRSKIGLYAYVDSDWAVDTKARKSVNGLVEGRTAYKSKSQTTMAYSTTEAEFTAATDCVKTTMYLNIFLEEVGLATQNETIIYEDNTAAIEMKNTQRLTRGTIHTELKHFTLLQWCKTDYIHSYINI